MGVKLSRKQAFIAGEKVSVKRELEAENKRLTEEVACL
jgi:hypothetical protein